MSLENSPTTRTYKCLNKECNGQFSIVQKIKDKWKKRCPFCHKNELILDSATLSVSVIMDSKKPKTMGMQSQHNIQRKDREEGCERKKRPFWRNKNKLDFKILKNPTKYITTGEV